MKYYDSLGQNSFFSPIYQTCLIAVTLIGSKFVKLIKFYRCATLTLTHHMYGALIGDY